MQADPLPEPCPGESLQNQVLQFIVDFQGVQMSVLRQSGGQAYSRIAGKAAQFQHPACAAHLHNHFQEPTLYRAGEHTGVVGAYVRLLLQPVQGLTLRAGAFDHISLNGLHLRCVRV